ncbi:phenylacetate--CoA ligase family protein [Lacrimispora sp. NSJ-141]|uniref:Phenylacetate--CoA ligase family protein n=1 Tax=Lientehia hominis TaxID=2897778 RepID=A0AAP2RHP6_9FIRM|nr:phenylacetate--CoA ligase family protein [Lientehia hominis]MCD2492347.1 phenylacetate--CoA ligase family protein [Lientehia hominis]
MNCLKLLWGLYSIKRNERKTYTQIQNLQEKKLRKMLQFAYGHSVHYRRTFEAAGITKDHIESAPLRAFPTLSKAELLDNFDELITVSGLTQEEMRRFDAEETVDRKPFKGKYHVVHSSGSTGKPGYFLYDTPAWNCMLLGIIRGALWGMSMPQILKLLACGPRIVYLAATDGRYGGAMAVGDGIDGIHASQLYLDIKTPLSEWIRQIGVFKPNIIIGYPSAVKILAELVERGEIHMKVIRVISCGEPLGSSLRHYIETVFHTQAVNFYGASESLALGAELDPTEGMILFDDMNLIEATDSGIYLTSLYNFAQPLIRYHISDNLILQKPETGSRCSFLRASGLLGRNEDILWFTDGSGHREFLHPLAIEGFCIEGLLDYQFRQLSEDAFEMLAETSLTASRDVIRTEMLKQMRCILEEKKLSCVQFYVRFVDEIQPDPKTGKKRLIVKEMQKERVCS